MDDVLRPVVAEGPEEALGSLRRQIPRGFVYDPRALKPLARMLWALSVALGHSLTAYRQFARLKSSTVSPDGRIGGRGYVMDVRDVRSKIQEACELLSAVSDTIHDEINAPHWRPRLSDLGANDAEDVAALLEKSREILDDPEAYGEGEERKIEEVNDGPSGTPNDTSWEDLPGGQDPLGSKLPGAGDPEVQGMGEQKPRVKEASLGPLWWKVADSSLPVNEISGGPRVDHIGPGRGDGPWGSYSDPEPVPPRDDWSREEGVGLTDPLGLEAASSLPLDDTPSNADAFGRGFGEDGSGSEGYSEVGRGGRGVFGPASRLPGSNGDGQPRRPREFWIDSGSELPGDEGPPVARSDTYEGPKGNSFDVTIRAESDLPGATMLPVTYDRDLPGVSDGYQDLSDPYVYRNWTYEDRQEGAHRYRYDYDRNDDV